jgi:glycosyltransferase involved in cell wall biosynthesis
MPKNKNYKILVLQGYYIPAFKAGGPVKTIKNMVDILTDFQFSIITRDRDIGDLKTFSEIETNKWQKVGNANVLYLSSYQITYTYLYLLIKRTYCDVIYLNSFFDYNFSIKPLIILKLLKVRECPIVLAPRGEFSKGALALKSFKKKLFIKVASILGLHNQIIWQASSILESRDITEALSVSADNIFVAKNLPTYVTAPVGKSDFVTTNELRVVFLSRISPKKNLHYAIEVLKFVKGEIIFDIYGPKEDKSYWKLCFDLIQTLPANIKVNYCGIVKTEQVALTFSKYDLFFFPTLGENYGHVIAEAISVGTPVLISNQTPWRKLLENEVGWDLPLKATNKYIEIINFMQSMSLSEKLTFREKVKANGIELIYSNVDIEANINLFEFTIKRYNEFN